MRAAVVRGPGELQIEDIDHPGPPGPGEVLVRLVATGICHTDLTVLRGALPVPLPIVLGHEGAGVVESVGEGVRGLAPGDHVVASIVVSCGACFQCNLGNLALCEPGLQASLGGTLLDGSTRLRSGGESLNHLFCQSTFAEYAVIPARSVVPVDPQVPLADIAPLGCGASTGIGAVLRRADVRAGSSVLVIGSGGVGLATVMGARAAGAGVIIAADLNDAALERARSFGATHTINPSTEDLGAAVLEITARGVDYAFDAVGTGDTLAAAFGCARAGGEVVAIGIASGATTVTVDLMSLLFQKRLTGTFAGSISPAVDIPVMVNLYRSGRLPLNELVSASYKLEELPQAFADMEAGKGGRGVVVF